MLHRSSNGRSDRGTAAAETGDTPEAERSALGVGRRGGFVGRSAALRPEGSGPDVGTTGGERACRQLRRERPLLLGLVDLERKLVRIERPGSTLDALRVAAAYAGAPTSFGSASKDSSKAMWNLADGWARRISGAARMISDGEDTPGARRWGGPPAFAREEVVLGRTFPALPEQRPDDLDGGDHDEIGDRHRREETQGGAPRSSVA